MSDLVTGTHLGAWKILRTIGRGGMGEVYEAENTLSGTRRALKRIRPELLASADSRDRFLREVALSQRVRHPNLVECLDPFTVGDHVILPMELLVGETLSARLSGGAMSEREAVAMVAALARGAGALHREGLVHRDLKPGNVFLARTAGGAEVPKILDLGATHEVLERRLTQAGFALGTLAYMAPEQLQGERVLDARVDVWALGVLLYIALTGRRPVESDSRGSILEKHGTNEPIPIPSVLGLPVSRAVEVVLMRCLSRRREDRFDDGYALSAALEASVGVSAARAPASAVSSFDEATSPEAVPVAPSGVAARSSAAAPPVDRPAPRVPLVLDAPRTRAKIELDRSALRVSSPPGARVPPRRREARLEGPWRTVAMVAILALGAAGVFTIGPARTAVLLGLGLATYWVWGAWQRHRSSTPR